MLLIGIGGLAQTGKGTVARMMRRWGRKHGLVTSPNAYAWPLKMRVGVEKKFTVQEVLTKPPHVREAFQIGGTEEGRDKYGDNYWVDQLDIGLALLYDEEPDTDFVTVVDARFPNELEYIRSRGGVTLWIDSDRGALKGTQATHRSETSVNRQDFDFVITNNTTTTLDNLSWQVEVIMDKLQQMGYLSPVE